VSRVPFCVLFPQALSETSRQSQDRAGEVLALWATYNAVFNASFITVTPSPQPTTDTSRNPLTIERPPSTFARYPDDIRSGYENQRPVNRQFLTCESASLVCFSPDRDSRVVIRTKGAVLKKPGQRLDNLINGCKSRHPAVTHRLGEALITGRIEGRTSNYHNGRLDCTRLMQPSLQGLVPEVSAQTKP
jgi:hypothetical protein